jgi:exodeoxyribonuclease VII small subunit
MPARKKDEDPKNFEDAMKRLEEIVSRLEEDQLPLEEMLARYEQGVSLARYCSETLDAAEQKVALISRQSDGSIQLEKFEDVQDH